MNQRFENALNVLNNANENKVSIGQSCTQLGFGTCYINDLVKRGFLEKYLEKSEITTEEYNEFIDLYNQANGNKQTKVSNINAVDTTLDDKFDKRSTCWENRSDEGKINSYGYKILVRDEQPLTGTLTREQMELIHANYPYINQQSCSQLLPFINFIEFTKIIRVFNIRKTSLFPKHILEEKTEYEISEIVLKNKSASTFKKIVEQRPIFVEKELRNVQKELLELKENREYIDNLLDKYFTDKPESIVKKVTPQNNIVNNSEVAYCLFSDIHYGKKFDRPVFGRGYNKEIAHERMMEIAFKTVQYCQTYKSDKLIIVFGGDLLESACPIGMRPQHTDTMDITGEQQIFFAVDSFKEALLYIYNNLPSTFIQAHFIGGNHDRIMGDRDTDIGRTASRIAFKILQRELENKIEINLPENNIIRTTSNNMSIIAYHGDNGLAKKSNSDILNVFGQGTENYHLIISGHFHKNKIEAGTNFMRISLGSVCSTDEFVLENLAFNNLPSFVLGKKHPKQNAFDYSYINLY